MTTPALGKATIVVALLSSQACLHEPDKYYPHPDDLVDGGSLGPGGSGDAGIYDVVTEKASSVEIDASPGADAETRDTGGADARAAAIGDASSDRGLDVAGSATGAITEFTRPGLMTMGARAIAEGADGNLWFVADNLVGRIIPSSGAVTEFVLPTPDARPLDIVGGSDGNLWFTERFGGNIGRITPAGVITEFSVGAPNGPHPWGIAKGPDGALWFAEYAANSIGRITVDGSVTKFSLPRPNTCPQYIAAGPDGNLWFTTVCGNSVGRITPSGVVTEHSVGEMMIWPHKIVSGPDGNLWFTNAKLSGVGRISTDGVVRLFMAPPGGSTHGLAFDGGGNLWFSNQLAKLVRFTPAGEMTEFGGLTGAALDLTLARDGNIWYGGSGNKIGRISP
jgi:virginiamycin B lyase